MAERRRFERVRMTADLILRPGQGDGGRFGGTVFSLSEGGAAVFTQYSFRPGTLLGLEVILYITGVGVRWVVLAGTVRYLKPVDDGNVLGIEFLRDGQAEDYCWFARYVRQRAERMPAGGE